MTYALVVNDTITETSGAVPPSAVNLQTGGTMTPPGGQWTDEQAALCGWLPVTTTPRPPNTETTTWDKSVALVGGLPEEVWTERPYTDAEVHNQEVQALRTDFDVAQSQLTPDQTNALLAADAPPDGDPWRQPTGAHDAYPLGAIVTHDEKTWESLVTANVHAPGVSGWLETGTDWPAWVQPAGGHDAYQIGAQVSHPDGGTHWISTAPDNVWEPGVYGWEQQG